MDCRKTQRLFDEFSDGRLAAPLAEQLQRHLADCTDCRVAQQRAARLRRLLALKRYEQPAPTYFQGFLGEFHRRLQAETAVVPSLWTRLKAQWQGFQTTTPVWTLRYGLSGAAGVLLVAGIALWTVVYQTKPMAGERSASLSSQAVNSTSTTGGSPMLVAQDNPADLAPVTRDVSTDPTTHMILTPATASSETSAPQYVLDHLVITPASYEGPRVDF